ncbi:MAG TPA: PDZ domain-containing protein [Chitinophagaceae bacterium]|nr:PDZ domain-containing protein [Chitinophagaceae bacterium]
MKTKNVFILIFLFSFLTSFAQKSSLAYIVKMNNPEWHFFHVQLSCMGIKKDFIDFKMPVWTPGYYQKMDYGKNLERLKAIDEAGHELKYEKTDDNTWRVFSKNSNAINLTYEIKTIRSFVATPYVDETRAYILPAGVFLYVDKMINHPVQVALVLDEKWNRVATGLDSISGKKFTYTAPDFDILYDSPLLAGNLEELPSFKIRGITHRFIGYKLGDFDREQFILDLKKVVEAAVNIIGHIPYKNYTFIGIGPGQGGIEHLNNTTFGFNGSNFKTRENYIRALHFLAHEYFHHYNVKRIRPIELGPFDYDKGSRTKMLWVSEGLSVYYEYMAVRRAGITTDAELFNAFRGNMMAFENKPGRLYQTLEQASYETWSDGPFGRTGDEVNKTISYYDKGPAVGLLFDFKIRQLTNNKKSLDDVMRFLYKEYYQKMKRGFTEEELKNAFEIVAGSSLAEEYEYVTTTKEPDYPKYFSYAGLNIDTITQVSPAAYAGFTLREREDSVFIANVEYESPGWNAGIRKGQQAVKINGEKASVNLLNKIISASKAGDKINLTLFIHNESKDAEIVLGKKTEKTFKITPVSNPDPLQKQILEGWLKG